MDVILTHNHADFDGVAAMLAAHKLFPDAVPILPARMNGNVDRFFALYQRGLPHIRWEDFHGKAVTRIILVDTQQVPEVRHLRPDAQIIVFDHHQVEPNPREHDRHIEQVGATTTLLVERLQERGIVLEPLEATLLALGIYEDTGAQTYATTTHRDLQAASWLLRQNAALDTVRRFLAQPLNIEQQQLFEQLVRSADSRTIEGYTVTVCAGTSETYIEQINSVAHRLRDMLDPMSLFVVVQLPHHIQMVCRATSDALDVGTIARHFGGGGHSRAAAAAIDDRELNPVVDDLWQQIALNVQPIARIAELMSYGVQTVNADDTLADTVKQLRRIGHEGFPVLDADGQVIGLLTLRDADRAIEHGMKGSRIRDVMNSGSITVRPEDAVAVLEQRMSASGWGQIPVVDEDGAVIGIVTRTDLINHWAQKHPAAAPPAESRISDGDLSAVIGPGVTTLIRAVADHAQNAAINIYLVGGIVRDVLLKRPNFDVDFVVEGDAIDFARALSQQHGGEVKAYRPFNTAKWRLDDSVAASIDVPLTDLPETVDFATSRNEFYEHPTALPTAYGSSIKLDLHRRDFTINTLAVQLSPATVAGRILDFYGGLGDLQNGIIRVLHSLSFVDDPTRILRAVRFEQRLDFTISDRTTELIESARPMLQRITGRRLFNEFNLILKEARPEKVILALDSRDLLHAIHPAFTLGPNVAEHMAALRGPQDEWPYPVENGDLVDLAWHIMLAAIPPTELRVLAGRLMMTGALVDSIEAMAHLLADPGPLADLYAAPSRMVNWLRSIPHMALVAAWLIASDELVRDNIKNYAVIWENVHPVTTGHTLRERGVPAGPRYREILEALRRARLDGQVNTDAEERALLDGLIQESGGS